MRIRFSPFKVSVAVAVTAVATLGGALAASAADGITPRPAPGAACVTPAAPAGTTITVNSHGDASAPAQPGQLDYRCTAGAWVRIHVPARPQHHLPSWLHARRIPGACGRGQAGVMLWASGADQSVVICKSGDIEPS
jgi:hypothetical protein